MKSSSGVVLKFVIRKIYLDSTKPNIGSWNEQKKDAVKPVYANHFGL